LRRPVRRRPVEQRLENPEEFSVPAFQPFQVPELSGQRAVALAIQSACAEDRDAVLEPRLAQQAEDSLGALVRVDVDAPAKQGKSLELQDLTGLVTRVATFGIELVEDQSPPAVPGRLRRREQFIRTSGDRCFTIAAETIPSEPAGPARFERAFPRQTKERLAHAGGLMPQRLEDSDKPRPRQLNSAPAAVCAQQGINHLGRLLGGNY
jgi:hypothetical protein